MATETHTSSANIAVNQYVKTPDGGNGQIREFAQSHGDNGKLARVLGRDSRGFVVDRWYITSELKHAV